MHYVFFSLVRETDYSLGLHFFSEALKVKLGLGRLVLRFLNQKGYSERQMSPSQRPLPTQHITNPRHEHPCPQRDSSLWSQHSSGGWTYALDRTATGIPWPPLICSYSLITLFLQIMWRPFNCLWVQCWPAHGDPSYQYCRQSARTAWKRRNLLISKNGSSHILEHNLELS